MAGRGRNRKQRIAAARRTQHLSPEDAARALGVSVRTLHSYREEAGITGQPDESQTVGEGLTLAVQQAPTAPQYVLRPKVRAPRRKSWFDIVGDPLSTSQVRRLLGISDKQLAEWLEDGRLIGIRGKRTTWFPAWQFDRRQRCVRPIVEQLTSAFREHLSKTDPLLIASWATSRQWEDLDGETPANWIECGRSAEQVTESAHRAAVWLGQ